MILGVPDIQRLEKGLFNLIKGAGGCWRYNWKEDNEYGLDGPCRDWLCSKINGHKLYAICPCWSLEKPEIIERVKKMIETGRTLDD